MDNTENKFFNLGQTFNLRPEAKKLELQVYFRGLGGYQDTIMTLVKLREANIKVYQYVMIDGENEGIGLPRSCSGESTIGITTFFMPDNTDFISEIYDALFDMNDIKQIHTDHWLNDFDQYIKIQVRHRVEGGQWSDWTSELDREVA